MLCVDIVKLIAFTFGFTNCIMYNKEFFVQIMCIIYHVLLSMYHPLLTNDLNYVQISKREQECTGCCLLYLPLILC